MKVLRQEAPQGYRLPRSDELKHLDDLHNKIREYRILINETKNSKVKKECVRLRRSVNEELIRYLDANKIYWVPDSKLGGRLVVKKEDRL